MQFKDGTHVSTADGKDVGVIERVVLNPHSKVVTHIVVRQGLLFTEDKVIPVAYVAQADGEQVRLIHTEDQLPEFAPFEETYYQPLDDSVDFPKGYVQPYYAYPPLGTAWWGYPGYMSYNTYPVPENLSEVRIEQNIPDHTIGLSEGAQIVSFDGESLGELTRVYIDKESARATHIIVAKGWLFKERKLIPTSWINKLEEHKVYLSISKHYYERLPLFDG